MDKNTREGKVSFDAQGPAKHKALTKRIEQPVKHRMIKAVKSLESLRSKKSHEVEY